MASVAGLLLTVNSYTLQEADLTNKIADIMENITRASAKSSQVLSDYRDKKTAVRERASSDKAYADSAQYDADMSAVEDDYELQLSEINNWEKELEQEKDHLETELKVTDSYLESFKAALKQNVQKSFKYGQNGG